MADGMIMERANNLSALLLGLTIAMPLTLTGVGQVSMAQAQTAQAVQPQTDAQIAAQVEVESLNGSSTSLRAQYAEMVRHSGKVLVFDPQTDTNTGEGASDRFVLYAPLNRLWLLDAADEVTRHAWIEVKQTPFDHMVLHWTHWLDGDISDILPAAAQMPGFTVESDAPHPLAATYDALLARPLAQALDPLPAGAYFSAGGHVFDATGAPIAEWDSYGAEIALRLMPTEKRSTVPAVEGATDTRAGSIPESTTAPLWKWFAVADLAAALNPEQPSEQGKN